MPTVSPSSDPFETQVNASCRVFTGEQLNTKPYIDPRLTAFKTNTLWGPREFLNVRVMSVVLERDGGCHYPRLICRINRETCLEINGIRLKI